MGLSQCIPDRANKYLGFFAVTPSTVRSFRSGPGGERGETNTTVHDQCLRIDSMTVIGMLSRRPEEDRRVRLEHVECISV